MTVIQPRPTDIPYQCAKFGDDRASFSVIFDVGTSCFHVNNFPSDDEDDNDDV